MNKQDNTIKDNIPPEDLKNFKDNIAPEDDPKLASARLVNFIFNTFYFKFVLYFLCVAVILLVVFIFLLPILVILHSADSTFYRTTNDNNILVSMLLRYSLTKYNWCNLSTFSEGLSNYLTYKFYTPVVIIFYASVLIYFTFLLFFLHGGLLVIINLLTGGNIEKLFTSDIKQNFIRLSIVIAIIYLLWLVIYVTFYIIILRFVKQAVEYNNNVNDILENIINNKDIFPLSKKKQKQDVFDDIIDRRLEPLIVMKNYYDDLESFQFKNSNACAKYLLLYSLLEYFQYVDSIIDDSKYREKLKYYLLHPMDNKDLLIGFTLDNFTFKEFVTTKQKPINEIIDDIFGKDIETDRLAIRKEYNRLLKDNFIDLLEKSDAELSKIQLQVYPVIIVFVTMIIIFILTKYRHNI